MSQSLAQRISKEFDAHEHKKAQVDKNRESEAKRREERLAKFSQTCEQLKAVWRPRLEEFASQFGDRIKVTPNLSPTHREAKVHFQTHMASITLTLTVSPNADVTKLVIDYDLLIIPVYFQYERHASLEMPLDQVDADALGSWLDDRLVSCVKTYLAVQDNELYIKRAMVEDPVSKVKFMREDAAATIVHNRQTHHFASEQTLQEYAKKHELTLATDPISGDRLVRESAAATIEHNGEQLFFSSRETLKEFKDKHHIAT